MTAAPLPLVGTVSVPGDKSISHRALLLAALAPGRSRLSNVNLGADVLATRALLGSLGVTCEVFATHRVEVEGCGLAGLQEPENVIDAGNSATTVRLGLGILAGIPVAAAVTGDDSLRRRPMLRVVAPLRRLGANIDGRHGGDRAPLWVRGGDLRAADIAISIPSAQVKSALLLAGLQARGTTSVTEPRPSRDHTERMLAAAGIRIERSQTTVALTGGQTLQPVDRTVPGDLSSAAFLIVAAALIGGSELEVSDVGLNPTRSGALEVLAAMGADVRRDVTGNWAGEPVGRVTTRASELTGVDVGPEVVPSLIDEVPALAVAATQARGKTEIRGAEELRVKESDRIDALAGGLNALGADVEPRPDGLVVRGPTSLGPGKVDARGDHRIALAFAVAGLISGAHVEIDGWDAVGVSFPTWREVVEAARGGER